MKTRYAPLYVKSYDLTLDLLTRCDKLPRQARPVLGARIQEAACTLLEQVSLALTFVEGRESRLLQADEALLSLRLSLRLAGDRQLLGAGELRFVHDRLDEVGRMLGGWRRSLQVSSGPERQARRRRHDSESSRFSDGDV